MASYTDGQGVRNRAYSAMLRMDALINDRTIPAEVRLVRMAEIMDGEPILTDTSPAAYRARRASAGYVVNRNRD